MTNKPPQTTPPPPSPGLRKLLAQTLSSTRKSYYPQLKAQLDAAQSQQRQLQLLIDSLPARISYVDNERRYVFVNQAYERDFAMDRGAIVGKTVAEIIGSQYYAKAKPFLDRVLAGETVRFELHFDTDDVASAWYEVNYIPDTDDQGQILGFYSLTHDLSELRAREEDLRHERDLLDNLFDNILLGITLWSTDGRLLRINRGFIELTGYTLAAVPDLSTWFQRAYPDPAYRKFVLETWRQDHANPCSVREFAVTCGDGAIRQIEFRASFLTDGRALVTLSDISERKLAEAQIRENERRFRGMFESAPVGVAIIDTERRFMEVNQQLCTILGYRPEEMVGRSLNAFTHPEDRGGGRERWRQLLHNEAVFNQAEKRYLHKDGHVIWVIVSNTLIRDDLGHPKYFLSHLIDISAQKKAQAEKSAYEIKLVQAQKMEAIGTLAGGLAHDFNNLLMGIQGRVSLMLHGLPPDHRFQKHLASIEDHVRSAASITQQLLGYARGGKYDVKTLQLNELLMKSATMFGRTKKEIQIHHDLQSDLPTIEADGNQMEQVFLNLFVNAWQAMPDGGQLYLKTQAVELSDGKNDSRQLPPGTYAKISVTDTGIGMDAAIIEKIFDPFFSTKEKNRGTGLGLASVYGIVKNHGGSISASSEPGRGTTFNLHFPVSKKVVQSTEPINDSLQKGHETLLLVDDEALILEVGCSLLERLGYRVLVADSGMDAINMVAQAGQALDLVILDLIMPGMDGGETFYRIREVNPFLRVLLSSGYARDGKADTILKKGCNGFIQKPFTLAALSKKVRAILDAD